MKEELTNVLQYSKYSYEGHGTGNLRNGYYTRNYDTKYGMIENLKIPRDRNNEFEQKLIPPYARRDDWIETMIIRMYASGVSTRVRGFACSPDTLQDMFKNQVFMVVVTSLGYEQSSITYTISIQNRCV